VYSLYADVCAGVVGEEELERVLEVGETYREAIRACRRALPEIPRVQIVDRILIHLDGQTPPSRFREYGSRLVPFYNYFQAACVLLERRALSPEAVLRIAAEFIEHHGFSADSIARSYLDLQRRGHAAATAPALLEAALSKLEPSGMPIPDLSRAVALLGNDVPRRASEPEARAPHPDYVKLAERYRGGRNRRRPGMSFG
jgi:hypothetical protein